MNDFYNHSRDNLKQKKAQNSRKKKTLTELDKEIEAYITSSDEDLPLLKLASALKALKIPPQMAKRMVKEAIRDNIKTYDYEVDDYQLYLQKGLDATLQDFDISKFIERSWQYRPIALNAQDYALIQQQEKCPIFINRYDYTIPIHKFGNNINFQNEFAFKKKKIINNNDVQFYTTKDENMLFAKVTNIKFEPINYARLKEAGRELEPNEKEKLKYNPRIYNRTFSISLYVMLEGDPKKSHPFLRYDSSPCTHTNMFLDGDKRVDVYGYEADNPHFHFQNEDDALLCIRKYRDNNRHIKWKTGKCNSIDCKHLIKYLLKLDNMERGELEKQEKQNLNYGMPFLNMKLKGKKVNTQNTSKYFENYPCLNKSEADYIARLREDFKTLNSEKSVGGGDKSFKRLISSLQLLQFVTDERSKATDNAELEILSNLEVECATDVINAITNSSQKIIEKDYKPKFVINNHYIKHEGEEEKE